MQYFKINYFINFSEIFRTQFNLSENNNNNYKN
uniref:Uncharacterized protein n=1 Tax=viral metagenome TaxID=1070528 RepID=A0A6C0H8K7_9ZZZZ